MDNKEEIFRTIKRHPRYQVSNKGRVLSNLSKPKILKPSFQKSSGYFRVCLDGKQNRIHQLVAEAFLNHELNGSMYLVVNHIDFNKLNNNLDNLEIVSQRVNANRKHIKSSSKYVGVHWAKENKKWQARIYLNKKLISLGMYFNEIDAHNAYQKFIIENNL